MTETPNWLPTKEEAQERIAKRKADLAAFVQKQTDKELPLLRAKVAKDIDDLVAEETDYLLIHYKDFSRTTAEAMIEELNALGLCAVHDGYPWLKVYRENPVKLGPEVRDTVVEKKTPWYGPILAFLRYRL